MEMCKLEQTGCSDEICKQVYWGRQVRLEISRLALRLGRLVCEDKLPGLMR